MSHLNKNLHACTHHRTVTICFLGGPLNSSFNLCSRIQTTVPTTRKKTPVTAHISGVKGRKNAQAFEFSFLTGATTTSPDSMYGWLKSTAFVRFVTIAMSPTAASKTYKIIFTGLVGIIVSPFSLISCATFFVKILLTPVVI